MKKIQFFYFKVRLLTVFELPAPGTPAPLFGTKYVYLHHVGPDLLLVVSALDLDNLQDTSGQGVVIHSK